MNPGMLKWGPIVRAGQQGARGEREEPETVKGEAAKVGRGLVAYIEGLQATDAHGRLALLGLKWQGRESWGGGE